LVQNVKGKKWIAATKRIIFNNLFPVSFKLDNAIDCAKCSIYTSKMAV